MVAKRKRARTQHPHKESKLDRPVHTYKVVWAGALFGFVLMLFVGWLPFIGPLMIGLAIGFLVKRTGWSFFAGFSAGVIGTIVLMLWSLLLGMSFAPMFLSASAVVGLVFGLPIIYGFLLMSFVSGIIGGTAGVVGAFCSAVNLMHYRNDDASSA
jgi:hypothetical protein